MAKKVNSFSELFQTSPLESDFFEGLDELIPSNVLQSYEVSTPIEPQPPIQPTEPEAGPSKKRSKRPRHIYSDHQVKILKAFYKVNSFPTPQQRATLGSKIGLDAEQIYNWNRRYQTQCDTQSDEQSYAELNKKYEKAMRKIEDLEELQRNLIETLQYGTCTTCRGPVLQLDVQPSRVVVHPQPEIRLSSVDGPIEKHLIRTDVQKLLKRSTRRPSSSNLPSERVPRPAHNLVGVSTELIADNIYKAYDELVKMATAGAPLWIHTPNHSATFQPESLLFAEYLHNFPSRGRPALHFRSEASRFSATIPIRLPTLVNIMMDVDRWSAVFCSLVTNAKMLEVLSSGIEGSFREQMQVMSAEYMVTSNVIPTREIQFVRYCHQQTDGSWVTVDVSLDELQTEQRPQLRSRCIRRPSGCLIRDLQNGSSYITWVEHVDVREDIKDVRFKHFVESGFSFGAKWWISFLHRQAIRFQCSTSSSSSPRSNTISPQGRRSLAALANRMVVSFCSDISNSTFHNWTKSNTARTTKIKVKTNKRRGDPEKPRGVIRTAATTNRHLVPHRKIFDFLRNVQTRHMWDSMSVGCSVQVLINIVTDHDSCNCISVLAIENQNDFLILQESFTDSMGSFLIYCVISKATFQSMLSGEDPEQIPLLPYGLSILPDVTTATSRDNFDGTLLTVVFQVSVTNMGCNSETVVIAVTQLLKDIVQNIKTAVH